MEVPRLAGTHALPPSGEVAYTTYQEVTDPSRSDEHVAMTKTSGRVATPDCQSNMVNE